MTSSAEGFVKDDVHVVLCEVHDDNSTILTARYHGKWFYAETKADGIQSKTLKKKYIGIAKAARKEQQQEENPDAGQQEPEETKSGKDEATKKQTESTSFDSGYGSDRELEQQSYPTDDEVLNGGVAEQELRSFLLPSLEEEMKTNTDKASSNETDCTLADWYNTDMFFYNLVASKEDKDTLTAESRDDLDGPKYIRQVLIPHLSLPKYLQKLSNIPWYTPDEINVLATSHDIHLSIHPTIVSISPKSDEKADSDAAEGSDGNTQYFLKLASAPDHAAVKRELKFLHLMAKRDLYGKGIRAPRLKGLVSSPASPGSHAQIHAFLLSLVPQPAKSLLHYMDEEVSASKRNTWAAEAERMVDILHENGLVWGDAKADNFMVDGEDKLWMIDFGGGYTPGWIDEDLADTEEGDDQALEKLTSAIRDPTNCMAWEEAWEQAEKKRQTDTASVRGGKHVSGKRDRCEADDEEGASSEDETSKKKRKTTA